MNFFHTSLQMYDSIFEINITVDDTAQLTCPQSGVEHQEVCRRLLINWLSVSESFEGFFPNKLQLLVSEHDHHIALRLALLVLRGKVVVLLRHVDQRHRIIRYRALLI